MRIKHVVFLSALAITLWGISSSSRGVAFFERTAQSPQAALPQPSSALNSSLTDKQDFAHVRHSALLPNLGDASDAPMSIHRTSQLAGIGTNGQRIDFPLLVDGSKNPEQISDRIAYGHFMSVISLRGNSPQEIARRDAFLAPLDLSPLDKAALLAIVASVRQQVTAIHQQRLALTHGDTVAFAELQRRQGLVIDNAVTQVQASLSADALKHLQTHIDGHVKRNIKVYGQAQ